MSGFAHLADIDCEKLLGVRKNVHDFRTKYGHYLDKAHDKKISQRCRFWFYAKISKEESENENDWDICVSAILNEAFDSLEAVKKVLGIVVEKDEKLLYQQWWIKQKRNIPKYRKIAMLDEIKLLYQLPYDSEIFYQRNQKQFDMVLGILDFSD
ncbi:MAG: hypothetical protein HFG81_11995 [Dorea sp.]|nr:hypothetical protein [Dorea sp.]